MLFKTHIKATLLHPIIVAKSPLFEVWLGPLYRRPGVCPAREGHYRFLVEAVGSGDLSHPALVQAKVRARGTGMPSSPSVWSRDDSQPP
ncbi:hypothetical protein B5X24_HaOG203562 [Helicoverpa armigera]|uniref:Uncharacterized protein n=1 Tax=Helicoverpa armigera TaxID=29058 RepID=A0A2W1BUB1_HELAM|nr:hypothetical protein B5X24_HaOG203562 [Helicoverpa armigera]